MIEGFYIFNLEFCTNISFGIFAKKILFYFSPQSIKTELNRQRHLIIKVLFKIIDIRVGR